MLLTVRRMLPILKRSNGQSRWVEQSELYLPKGGKKMDLGMRFITTFFIGSTIVMYVVIQADINPDSIYGKVYKIATVQGPGYFFNNHLSPENSGLDVFDPNYPKSLH